MRPLPRIDDSIVALAWSVPARIELGRRTGLRQPMPDCQRALLPLRIQCTGPSRYVVTGIHGV